MPELDHADSLELLHRQTTVLELIAGGAALPEMLTAVTVALEELIPGSRCSVLLLDGTTLHHGAAPSLPRAYSTAIDGLAIGPDAGSCGTAAHLDVEVVAEDILDDARWDRFRVLARPHGLRACWSSPIRGRRANGAATGVLGTFAVYHDVPHRPTARERRLVERFTHLSSVAIEHARLYGALTESEERFRRAFEDNAVGMALTGLDGRFGRVNRALREMLGRDEDALLAAGLDSVLDPPTAPAALAAIALCTSGDRDSVQFETTLLRVDGEPVRAGVTASVVRGAGGEPVYLSINVLDVTARRAAELDRRARREAELAREVAESASRAKSDFLSALSHELRTPLQAITGFTELLGTLDLTPARRAAALGHIGGASSHILALVDDVLDIAAIEAGALPLHPVDVDVAGLVGEVVDLLGPLADDRGVELVACAPCGTVRADPRRLRQVLINLVTNGVRYNHAGGRVRVRAGAGTIRVADSGPGIPEEHMERLFVPFDRLGADVGPEPGAGLGMVLARGLTEAMGGQLTVDSAPGSGTTVLVRLPVS
ncbi:ATP-binding protein [Pseudonocardia petroleophila]|uniref:histidine kinase n=1 Tax=Pseudonocardia petroleophila TaxID=37331 RepID=A0A7G7MIE0_9PSEU|nr:GAF domain-containing sensor histidine kinase [Pseudonocardia petroleophila]QNG52551.1 PAS domain S-box protein [Pseudonocardia petroleophila]